MAPSILSTKDKDVNESCDSSDDKRERKLSTVEKISSILRRKSAPVKSEMTSSEESLDGGRKNLSWPSAGQEQKGRKLSTAERISSILRRKSAPASPEVTSSLNQTWPPAQKQRKLSTAERISSMLRRKSSPADPEMTSSLGNSAVGARYQTWSFEQKERKLSTTEKLSSILRRKSSPADPEMMSSRGTSAVIEGKYRARGNLYRRFCIKRRKYKMKRRNKRRHSAPETMTGNGGRVSAKPANQLAALMEIDEDCDATHKVLLLGDSGVGKSALMRSLRGQAIPATSTPTIGKSNHMNIVLIM